MYILLSGTPPFYEEDNIALFETIKACKYDFDVETWNNVSDESKDFISRILVPNPEERMNCEDMLAHPWMTMELEQGGSNLGFKSNAKVLAYAAQRKS